jgi:hypothetical protein
MPKEKMVELKIKLPARWVAFMEDFYQVTGMERDRDLRSTIKASIEGFMLPELNAADTVRLVEKHQLADIYEIPQWLRDEAAGIPRKVKTKNPNEALAERAAALLTKKPGFNEACDQALKAVLIDGVRALTPEERAEIRGITS